MAGLGTNAAQRATQAARCAGGLFEVLNWWTTKGCLADGFLACPAFFAGLAFLPALRFGFAAAGSGAFD